MTDGTFIRQIAPALPPVDVPGVGVLGPSISGVLVGVGDLLYLGRNGIVRISQVQKSDGAFIGDFASPGGARDEGLECDPINFAAEGKLAIWSREAFPPGFISVIEVEPGTCLCGGSQEPPDEFITLAPPTDTNDVGEQHTVTATLVDENQNPVIGRAVEFEVTAGPHAGTTGNDITDAQGQASFTYTGTSGGTDTIVARFTDSSEQVQTSNEVSKIWEQVVLAESISLEPLSDTNDVGEEHTVTATILDENQDPVVERAVEFEVTAGPHAGTAGTDITDAQGQASFTYTGTSPGTDTIVARFTDSSDQVQTSNEVSKVWQEVVLAESISLEPLSDTNLVGEEHTVTATILDANQDPVAGRLVSFDVSSGPHAGQTGSDTTDEAGQASFTYTGTSTGTDTIVARFTDSTDQVQTSNEVSKVWQEVILAESISLEPLSDTNDVGEEHTVTATILDENQDPVVERAVEFEVTAGPHAGTAGTDITDAQGQASFTYTGTSPGTDTIVARFTDSSDQVQTSNEVSKVWQQVVLAESISLEPLSDTNDVGEEHTVTATILDENQDPVVERAVEFEVTAGPHAGTAGTDITDAQGQASFTYTGTSPGTDTIVARFTDSSEQVQTSNEVSKIWQAVGGEDDTPPECSLDSVNPGPPSSMVFSFQDTGSGLAAINVLIAGNTTVDISPFTPGTTDPVIVTLTKIDESRPSLVLVQTVDVAGNVIFCDPVLLNLSSRPGAPASEVVTGVPAAEGWVTVSNGAPGLRRLEITVNEYTFLLEDLAALEQRTVSVFSAMRPGKDNSFVLRSPDVEGSALVLISDVPPSSAAPARFRRGDVNADGRLDISDVVSVLGGLFLDVHTPRCDKAADVNDDGDVDLTDAIYTLAYLFDGGSAPPAPFHACGFDLTLDALECSAFRKCR